MSDQPPVKKSNRNVIVAGSVIGVGALFCGGGGLLLALLGGGWYAWQPVGLSFEPASWSVEDASPRPLPALRLHRRVGEPEPVTEGALWTVEPPALGEIVGGRFTPEGRGSGKLRACVGEICEHMPLTIALADTLTVTPERAEARVWSPRPLAVIADWRGAADEVPLTISSADPAVATVDASGTVTPVAPGSTEIHVRGGGAAATVPYRVYPQPPAECTLTRYADVLGRKGIKSEQQACLETDPDMCEWNSTQPLVDGGRIDEGGGWEWGWTTLWLPATDIDQAWAVAQRCLELPPEIVALGIPEMARASVGRSSGASRAVQLAGDWEVEAPEAIVRAEGGVVTVALPSACSSTRVFALEGAWIKLGVSDGC